MPSFNFASLGHGTGNRGIAYTVFSSSLELLSVGMRSDCACYWGGQYMTYGDGIGQHSGNGPIGRDLTPDFLASLATYLLNPKTPEEHLAQVKSHWHFDIGENKIKFLHSVRFKEGKRQYYSTSDEKVSTAEGKRHDRRWHEVPEYADGSVSAIYRLFGFEYSNILEVYGRYQEIVQVHYRLTNNWTGDTCKYTKFTDDSGMRQAYDTVDELVKMYRAKDAATRFLAGYNDTMNRKAKQAV